MKEHFAECIEASATTIASLATHVDDLAAVADTMIDALRNGNKVLTAGNGGSSAEALHMSEELIGRFRGNRRALPAVALVADCTALTCIGNDFGFDEIFSRQIQGLAKSGDVLVLFSTSGKAQNLLNALASGKNADMKTVCLLGRDGGPLAGLADHEIIIEGEATERIQEAHQVVLHLLLDAVERAFPEE